MQTKNGDTIPAMLAGRLQKSKTLIAAWDKLRPSCQRDYVTRVQKATNDDTRKQKVERVIDLTKAYAARHKDKYKGKA